MKLSTIMKTDLGYNPEAKAEFHKAAKRCLRRLAKELRLEKGEFDLRSNQGGIAVSGEVTLHTDCMYVEVSQWSLGKGHEVLYRTCRDRKDYTGGTNNWASADYLEDTPDLFAKRLWSMVQQRQYGNAVKESWAETMWR